MESKCTFAERQKQGICAASVYSGREDNTAEKQQDDVFFVFVLSLPQDFSLFLSQLVCVCVCVCLRESARQSH